MEPILVLLENPMVLKYLIIIGTALLGSGLILGSLRLFFGKRLDNVWAIYRGWLMMAPLAVGFLLAGRSLFIVGTTLLAFAGFREFSRATGLHRSFAYVAVVYVGILACGIMCLMVNPRLEVRGWYGLFMALPVYTVGLIMVVPVILNQPKGALQATALSITGFVYFGWMFSHLGFLANAEEAFGYLFFLVFAVGLNDISAFLFGKWLGGPKLRSNISPNKTLGGSLGALGVSMILPWMLWFSFPHFKPFHLILTGLIVGIGGQLGDLTISFIKRDLAIKDMGKTIPGHGGILDRIDSMIFVAPLFFHMVRWYFGIYQT